ncbi:MAG TPA: sugar-binding protein [Phycisphaerae bacterium]|nr:sugar-binding protein [Phycisphaerae bacterium]
MTRDGFLLASLLGACFAAPAAAEVSSRDVEAIWDRLPRPRLAVAATKAPPKIDGKIDDDEWSAASVATGFLGTDSPKWRGLAGFDYAAAQTTVRVTHDAKCLYVAFRCDEPEIETLQVTGTRPRDGALWRDDCVELFLQPPGAEHHFHLIVNSKGWVYDAKNSPTVKKGADWDAEGLKVAASASPPGAGSYWAAELAVPFVALGAEAPGPDAVWGADFARERYAASYKAIIEYSTWSGLVGGFGRPERFGELCFCGLRQDIRLPRPFLGRNDLAGVGELASLTGPRKLKLLLSTASGDGVAESGAAQPAEAPATGKGMSVDAVARVGHEGTQLLALTIADAATGKALSVTRVPFHVPDVLAAAGRVQGRLDALAERAGEGGELARGVAAQRAALAAAAAEARELRQQWKDAAAGPAGREQWAALRERIGRLEADATFVVWTGSPYVATGPGTMPPAVAPPPTLKIAAAQNESAHAIVNVTNLTERAIELQLDGELPGQVGRARSGLDTTVQKLAIYQPKLLGKKPTDLPEAEDGLAMPLVELNGLSTFFVRPFSTRQVWITVQTRGLKAGTKRGSLRLVPLSATLPPIAVPWEMTVWEIALADEAPLGVFCFDYAGDFDWMRSYKINLWFRGAFPSKLELGPDGNLKPYKTDIGRVKQRLDEGARKFLFSYGYAGSFIQWAEKSKVEYMSPQFRRLFKEVLSRMVREWLEAGLKYEDFALQSIDEAHGRGVQQVLDTTPLIREVDPKVRLAMTIMTDLAELKKMAPHVDVWLNRNGAIWGGEQAAFFTGERAKGKPIWSWNMPNNPRSQPLTQFRTYGWRAMKFDFDAIGFFLYFGLVYQPMRKGGGFATRHWEAWRDGVEDYQLLRALRDEVAAARQRGVAAESLAGAEKLLAACVDDVITEKFFPPNTQETDDRIAAAREKVAGEISRVRKMKR